MASPLINQLYDLALRLDKEGADATKHEDSYKAFLKAAEKNKSVAEKTLAAQLISKYFHAFENLQEAGSSALIDLCEEEDLSVRITAIRELVSVCKASPSLVESVASIIVQLLSATQHQQHDVATGALQTLLDLSPASTIQAVLNEIETGSTEESKLAAISFLSDKVIKQEKGHYSRDANIQKLVLDTVAKETFVSQISAADAVTLANALGRVKTYKGSVSAINALVALGARLEARSSTIDPTPMLAHIKDKVRGAARFYEKGESNSALLAYLVVLLNRYDTLNDKAQVNLLKVLAEISPYVTSGDVDYLWSAVSTMLKANLPSPDSVTSLNAAVLEMLLYSYHFLASKRPELGIRFLGSTTDDFALYSDMRKRLNYVIASTKAAQNSLTAPEKNKTAGAEKKQTEKEGQILLSKNVIDLAKRLVASPVSYITKSNLTLSYRGAGKKEPKAQIQNQKGADNKQQGKKTGSQQQKNNTAGNAVNGKNNNSSKPQAQRVKRRAPDHQDSRDNQAPSAKKSKPPAGTNNRQQQRPQQQSQQQQSSQRRPVQHQSQGKQLQRRNSQIQQQQRPAQQGQQLQRRSSQGQPQQQQQSQSNPRPRVVSKAGGNSRRVVVTVNNANARSNNNRNNNGNGQRSNAQTRRVVYSQ